MFAAAVVSVYDLPVAAVFAIVSNTPGASTDGLRMSTWYPVMLASPGLPQESDTAPGDTDP